MGGDGGVDENGPLLKIRTFFLHFLKLNFAPIACTLQKNSTMSRPPGMEPRTAALEELSSGL